MSGFLEALLTETRRSPGAPARRRRNRRGLGSAGRGIAKSPASESGTRPAPGLAWLGSLSGATVLVVEDSQDVREVIQLLLERFGARVLLAQDGQEALDVVATESVDLVLCDLRMPRLDGYGFISRFRQDARTARVPAIAVSAYSGLADQRRTREAGFDGYLSKPFDLAQLGAELERIRWRHAAA